MKKFNFLFLSSLLLFCFFNSSSAQIEVDASGNVGIGGSPNSACELEVHGNIVSDYINSTTSYLGTLTFGSFQSSSSGIETDAYGDSINLVPSSNNSGYLGYDTQAFKEIHGYHIHTLSDSRQKENISTLEGSLNLIIGLRGVKYDLKPEIAISAERRALIKDEAFINQEIEREKNQIGFIAQEVFEVLPNVVKHNDGADIYSIEYSRIIPVLVEAMKEQQIIIESMQSEIDGLKSSNLKSLSSISEGLDIIEKCVLHQNSPNPFGQNTTIRYSLPERTSNADIIIYDMTGKQLRRIPLTQNGDSSIEVHGGEMDPGMYMYSMIVENQLIATMQMVITE